MRTAASSAVRSPARRKTISPAAFDQRPTVDRVRLRLAVPPSSNKLHSPRKGGGIRVSDAYSTWLCQAGWRLSEQRPGRIAGGYRLTVSLPASTGMDLDNCVAGLSDLLQMHGVIANDCYAEETHLHWHGGDDQVLVELEPFVGPPRHQRVIGNWWRP